MSAPRTVALGYAVGSGEAVAIPIRNMCVAGQTQEAGKTTTLEALIARSRLRAVTFITKRGEGSFRDARRVDPYFRDQGDWQFVSSILEASRGEKLKFERAWIIRASKGARTLADVHANVRDAMRTAKGLAGDVYLTLDAYLTEVVPAIARVRWASALTLAAGVNVIDLTGIALELQHLVIKSSLDWVLAHEEDTIVVVPEAWKFVPEGRNTPVKRAADSLIRQGSGLRNYVWLDSQDIGGVSKETLRHCPVWLLGVQREANEIKRTLANMHGLAKPKAADVAQLQLGEFFACWGTHAVRTYVQPEWMPDRLAQRVALGAIDVANASVIAHGAAVRRAAARVFSGKENEVTKAEAEALQRRVEELADENRRWRETHEGIVKEKEELRRRIATLEHGRADRSAASQRRDDVGSDRATRASPARGASYVTADVTIDDALYEGIKARLIAEAPAVLRATVATPELEITRTRPVLTFEEHSMKWRLVRLLAEGFFTETKGASAIRGALKRTGPDVNTANIARAMDDLVKAGVFTDEGSGYRAVAGLVVRQGEA